MQLNALQSYFFQNFDFRYLVNKQLQKILNKKSALGETKAHHNYVTKPVVSENAVERREGHRVLDGDWRRIHDVPEVDEFGRHQVGFKSNARHGRITRIEGSESVVRFIQSVFVDEDFRQKH